MDFLFRLYMYIYFNLKLITLLFSFNWLQNNRKNLNRVSLNVHWLAYQAAQIVHFKKFTSFLHYNNIF